MLHASAAFHRLAEYPKRELERILAAGATPSVANISGYEYRGYNHPRMASLLGIRKFIKGFFIDERGASFGFNTPVRQNGIDGGWDALPSEEAPRRFGFFSVAPVAPGTRDSAYPRAILLDYGRGGNPALDISRALRDYVVRVEPGSDELLLGKAYLALGRLRLPVGFFLLERYRPLGPTAGTLRRQSL